MEPIVSGWLKKSPPDKTIWRAKWRRRWFVLRPSGQIPGQYMLEYFTDQSYRKLKGSIDLDQCEQVDVGVSLDSVIHRKYTYEHVFDIRTPKRIYYLVADREIEMNKWVDSICSVCGLKIHVEDEPEMLTIPANPTPVVDRQPSPSPSTRLELINNDGPLRRINSFSNSTLSVGYQPTGPYIPISECISGSLPAINGLPPRPNGNSFHMNGLREGLHDDFPPAPPLKGLLSAKKKMSSDCYDYPRALHPPEKTYNNADDAEDGGNVVVPPPKVNWATYPRQDAESALYENRKVEDDVYDHPANSWADPTESPSSSFEPPVLSHHPPPRPPKPPPPHLIKNLQQGNAQNNNNYDNINSVATLYDTPPSAHALLGMSPSVSAFSCAGQNENFVEDHYDFPRSHLPELSSTPPAPSTQSIWQRRHIYGNAPCSLVVEKEADDAQEYLPMDQQLAAIQHQKLTRKESDVYTDMSGTETRSPNFSVYSNVSSPNNFKNSIPSMDNPPAVNRTLKPRVSTTQPPAKSQPKRSVDQSVSAEETTLIGVLSGLPAVTGAAPAVDRQLKPKINFPGDNGGDNGVNIPTAITLSPAPNSVFINPPKGKRSFRKQRASPCPSPTASTNVNHSNGMLFPGSGSSTRLTDRSSSDDDQSSSCSSRRNSSNDDHHTSNLQKSTHRKSPSPSTFLYGRGIGRDSEIQYLDLDLENDCSAPAQSPKSPEKISAVQNHNTVYKTVDFVRTKAFNEMRQNVEETYRKS